MREILFRGKNKKSGEWIEGDLLHDGFDYDAAIWEKETKLVTEVDPATVGQYTGLTDKNGKKIFEGNVIRFRKFRDEPDWVGVVKYEYCSYLAVGRMPLAYEKRKGEEPYFSDFEVQILRIDKTTIEVIGNIHDNPELLAEEVDDG